MTLAAACSDTGMVIEASRSADFQESIHSIRFYIGKDTIAGPQYFTDDNPADDILLNGRDIASNPYRLLVRPKSENMGEVVVAAVAFNAAGDLMGFGMLDNLVSFVDGIVVEWQLELRPSTRGVIVTDTECLQIQLDNGEFVYIGTGGDRDCDGIVEGDGPGLDCNDLDPLQSPAVAEDCSNGIDDDCNGFADDLDTEDGDGDGFANCGPMGGDCNDYQATINPLALEECDGVDNNCDQRCDEDFDVDLDGVSTCGTYITGDETATTCASGRGEVDCDDGNNHAYPGNAEECDGIDNDCNGACDDADALDQDGDGYTTCGSRVGYCDGTDPAWIDCADDNPFRHPGKHELCDGQDNDCDGNGDPTRVPCFADLSGVDTCREGTIECQDGAPVGNCTPNDGPLLDSDWCSTWDECDGANPDHFLCSINNAGNVGTEENCKVRMRTPTEMCPQRSVNADLSGGSAVGDVCTYTVIGGGQQQGYKLLVGSVGGGIAPNLQSVNACQIGLQVNVFPDTIWPDDAVFSILFQQENGTEKELRLRLRAELVGDCNGQPGLECTTLNNLPLPVP